MAIYDYKRYKIRTERLSGQGLREGDLVRRQYVDGQQTIRSVMAVLATGTESIADAEGVLHDAPYFVGALLDGDAPHSGELLDFVRTTSLIDEARTGALYLTASDSEAPYMDVIDGAGTERSLCYPTMLASTDEPADRQKYALVGQPYLTATYTNELEGVHRICRIERNNTPAPDDTLLGLQQCLVDPICHPERLLVSFRARASQPLARVPVSLGNVSDGQMDGQTTIDVTPEWVYHLVAITAEYPTQYARHLTIDLGKLPFGAWCAIADLNVIRQDDAANLPSACKVRIGKISGVADPLFGVLEGYGAYISNLYATRNVNVAGTLTAGDDEGFASTFYVGRIHKNALRNSLKGDFVPSVPYESSAPPTGIGQVARISSPVNLRCQDESWCERNAGQRYCFSFWVKGDADGLTLSYLGDEIAVLPLDKQWVRHHVVLTVQHIPDCDLQLSFSTDATCFTCGYQLESGEHPSLYQPTDEVLNETEEYGAWFSRGGIGGTIQHPLLRLNDDGSITSCDGSFVINADGTGHFAGGRFRWSKDAIELRGVTIRWEDFDKKAQEALLPKSVSISGTDTFHYSDALNPIIQPASISLVATEQNFVATTRRWDYLAADGTWKDAGGRSTTFLLFPDFHAWEDYDVLTLRYTALHQEQAYKATVTITKQYDGESAYSVYIRTDKGTILQNGTGATTLSAHVMRGAEEVTEHLADGQFLWTRQSDDPDGDALWNSEEHRGRMLTIDGEDVTRKAVFNCDVTL